ncbi:MAG: ribonuclease P protein subunit [Candidatus Caldarchaeum sp.]|nr:ribonuclease P protein subunit [Candidatus Caldarchaeum sp.]
MSNNLSHSDLFILGKRVEAVYNNRVFIGFVVDETRNTIKIRTDKGDRTLPKSQTKLRINPDEPSEVKIEGACLVGRPHERLLRVR